MAQPPRQQPKRFRQSAALPYRWRGDALEVLLITSSGRGDWVIPKGLVEPDMTDHDSAAKEAWEEAGVRGRIGTDVVGTYEYRKWGGVCTVDVFDLRVDEVADEWPERAERRRRWAGVDAALELVKRDELIPLIRGLPGRVAAARR